MVVSLFCRIIIMLALLSSILLILPGVEDIYSVRRIIQLSITAFLVFSLLFNRTFFGCYGREVLLIVLLAVLALLSSVLYASSEFYLADVFLMPFWLLGVLALASWMRQVHLDRLIRFTLISLVILEFLYACLALFLYQSLLRTGEANLAESLPWGYHNIRFWGHTATWLLPLMPLALKLKLPVLPNFWRPVVYLSAGVMVWLVLLSMARGTMLALVVATFVVGLLAGRALLGWLTAMVRFVAFGGVLWLLLSWLIPLLVFGDEMAHKAVHFTSSGRIPLWLEAWQMSLQNFPLGMGGQSWITHEVITTEYAASPRFGHPHNMYLQWAAEYGWSYLVVLGGFWLLALGRLRLYTRLRTARHGDAADSEVRTALLISFMGACFHAFFSAVFWAPASMLLGMIISALLLASFSQREGAGVTGVSQSLWLQRTGAVLVTLVMLFWLAAVGEYFQGMRADRDASGYGDVLKPRFWLHGDFP